jgi:hypothetical protein
MRSPNRVHRKATVVAIRSNELSALERITLAYTSTLDTRDSSSEDVDPKYG